MDIDSQTKVLTQRITVHKSEITTWSRCELTNYSSSTLSVYWSRLGSFGALFR